MARFVPRSLRGQAAESEPEPHTEPVSGSQEPGEPVAIRSGTPARNPTANGVRRRPVPRPTASSARTEEGAAEAADESRSDASVDPVAKESTGRDAADREDADRDSVDAVEPDAEPEDTTAPPTGDTDDEPTGADRSAARKVRASGGTRTGVRPKRRSDSGAKPGASAEPRIRTGRKVVAAPRAGSNRREKAALATISRLRRTALNLAVWALIVGLLAGTAWYVKHRGEVVEQAGRDATAAASSAAQAIFSYDYRAFDESIANGKDFVTGDFAKEYANTTAGLKATAVKERAVVRAKVSVASVTYASSGRVEVLLFVNQYRRNVNISGEKVDENRVLLTMEYVSDEDAWLVADAAAI